MVSCLLDSVHHPIDRLDGLQLATLQVVEIVHLHGGSITFQKVELVD